MHAALHGVGRDVQARLDLDVHHAIDRLRGSGQGLTKAGNLALGRVAHFQIKLHGVALQAHIFDAFGADKVFARMGIDDGLENFKNRLFACCHYTLL